MFLRFVTWITHDRSPIVELLEIDSDAVAAWNCLTGSLTAHDLADEYSAIEVWPIQGTSDFVSFETTDSMLRRCNTSVLILCLIH